jgi:hypothetical protein
MGRASRWIIASVLSGVPAAGLGQVSDLVNLHASAHPALFDAAETPQNNRSACRAFLVSGQAEGPGYRGYSYVLLSSSAAAANPSVSEAILSAFLGLDDVNQVQTSGSEPLDLKVVYLPVLQTPPAHVSAAWLLAHFDYDRASSILAAAGESDLRKPYLVSYTAPLPSKTPVDQNDLLIRDLSGGAATLNSYLGRQFTPTAPAGGDDKVRGSPRLSGRAFLRAGKPENSGYGLYSYVLFGEPPNAGNRDLYRAILSAFLSMQEVHRYEEENQPRSSLNVTYLPLQDLPPADAAVDWLLDRYDYARAQIILSRLMNRIAGPYIISYSAPLSAASSVDGGRLLVEDLSGVPPDLAFLWMNEFTAQAGRPQYWDKPAVRNLMLNLRTQVAVAARAFEDVRAANTDLRSAFASRIKTQE